MYLLTKFTERENDIQASLTPKYPPQILYSEPTLFNADYLFKKSRKKTTALKTFLMDNAVVVGVGNIYANESLFLCGLHPLKLADNLTQKQCERLVETIKSVLTKPLNKAERHSKISYNLMADRVILRKNYWFTGIKANLVQGAVQKLKV